jgi:hypothetical protein
MGFTLEPLLKHRVRGQVRRQQLNRDDAVGLGVARSVNLAHAAAAEQL